MSFRARDFKELSECIDLIIDHRGKTPKKMGGDWVDSGIKTISAKNVHNGELTHIEDVRYVEEEIYKKWMKIDVKRGDCFIASEGATLGESLYWDSDEKIVLGQRLFCIRTNEKLLDAKYFSAYIRTREYQKEIDAASTGTSVLGMRQSALLKTKVLVPSIFEQRYIGNIYYNINKKIEVNNQINKTLEKMAQAIFKQWFVNFEFPNEEGEPYQSSGGEMVESELGLVPKGWSVTELQDIAEITMGQSPKGTSYNENGEGLVFYQGRTDFNKRFPERRLFTTEPKRIAKKGDVLLSVRAPVGDLNIANEDCCIGRGLGALHSKCGYDSYLLYTMFKLKEKFDVFNGEGTVFGSINKNDLCSLKIVKTPDDIISKFEKVVSYFDKQIYTLEMESRNLAKIRDLLLPELMAGEVRISSK